VGAFGIDRRAHREAAVRIGRPEHRAVVVVADREGVREPVEERQVFAGVVTHRVGAVAQPVRAQVSGKEAVHRAAVPAFVHRRPLVRDVVDALAAATGVEAEGKEMAAVRLSGFAGERLVEDRFAAAVGQFPRGGITEPAHTAVGAVVAVERAVLVDEDHDVLNRVERPAGSRRGEHTLEHARGCGECLESGQRPRGRARSEQIASCQPPCRHGARITRRSPLSNVSGGGGRGYSTGASARS
jgi:hypothetical protein